MESGVANHQREGRAESPDASEYRQEESDLKGLESRTKPRKNEAVDQKDAKITLDVLQSQSVLGDSN